MKKYLSFLLGVLLFVFLPASAFAQEGTSQSSPVMPVSEIYPDKIVPPVPVPQRSVLPFGQKHYYTVNLRGNGEAIVYLKTIVSNKEKTPLSSLKVTFPQSPQDLTVHQVFREPQCIQYKPLVTPQSNARDTIYMPNQECVQYQAPDYEYGWGNTTYKKAQFSLKGNEATISLAESLQEDSAGSLILSYTLSGITDKNLFGAYSYEFETAKVDETIQNLQVGIMTDPDYYLKDTKGTINYQAKEAGSVRMSAPLGTDMAMSSVQFDQFYNQIGQGTIVKTASSLQSNESYKVKGEYADSQTKLYSQELALGVGAILLILIIGSLVLFLSVKKIYGKKEDQSKSKQSLLMPVLGLSFGSSLFILLYTTALYAFSTYFGQIFQYHAYNNFIYPLVFILAAVISLSIYSLFLFVPGIFIGVKKGIFAGILTVVLTVFWLIFYGIIGALAFFLFYQGANPIPTRVYSEPAVMMDAPATAPAIDLKQ